MKTHVRLKKGHVNWKREWGFARMDCSHIITFENNHLNLFVLCEEDVFCFYFILWALEWILESNRYLPIHTFMASSTLFIFFSSINYLFIIAFALINMKIYWFDQIRCEFEYECYLKYRYSNIWEFKLTTQILSFEILHLKLNVHFQTSS